MLTMRTCTLFVVLSKAVKQNVVRLGDVFGVSSEPQYRTGESHHHLEYLLSSRPH